MTAAARAKRAAPPVNPHLIGVLGLAILLGVAAMALLLLGDPRAATPRALAPVPPAPIQQAEIIPPQPASNLRRDGGGLDDPMLDVLAAPPETGGDVALPGVAPIDEAAPVRTSRELAEEESAAQRASLPPAPLAGLTEPGPGGPLPVIGPDGARPSDAYARPFADDGQPAVALIVGGLGWDADRTRRAIEELPPQVTLGFSPYAENLQDWIDRARAAGHEVVIEIPMQPFDYPQSDPAEHTLLTSLGGPANVARLEWLMSRATGYFAVMNYMGGGFFADEAALEPVFGALAARGVELVYDGARAPGVERAAARTGLAWAPINRAVDAQLTAADVQDQLTRIEAAALQDGAALGSGFAYPVVIDQAAAWAEAVEARGYQLAPASAVLEAKAHARMP